MQPWKLTRIFQAGHPVKNADILHQLPACPIPQLQCSSQPQEQPQSPDQDVAQGSQTHQMLRPSAISLKDTLEGKAVPANVDTSGESGMFHLLDSFYLCNTALS